MRNLTQKAWMVFVGFSLFSDLGIASQGIGSAEKILQDLNLANSFEQFVLTSAAKTLPGDQVYLTTLLSQKPELAKSKTKPKIIFEKGLFTVRVAQSSVTLKFKDSFKDVWEINGKEVVLHPFALAPERWRLIAEAIGDRKSAHITLFPIAWAEGKGEPTTTLVTSFLLSSYVAKENGAGTRHTMVGQTNLQDLLNKASVEDEGCSRKLISEVSLTLGPLAPTALRCDSNTKATVTFQKGDAFRVIRVKSVHGEDIVSDQDTIKTKDKNLPTECEFKLSDWSSEKCPHDRARIEQLKAWVPHLIESGFCLKCKPLIESFVPASKNKQGRH